MMPLDRNSQLTKQNHLRAEKPRDKIIPLVQTIWRNIVLEVRSLIPQLPSEPFGLDGYAPSLAAPKKVKAIESEPAPLVMGQTVKRTIQMDWNTFADKWFLSLPNSEDDKDART